MKTLITTLLVASVLLAGMPQTATAAANTSAILSGRNQADWLSDYYSGYGYYNNSGCGCNGYRTPYASTYSNYGYNGYNNYSTYPNYNTYYNNSYGYQNRYQPANYYGYVNPVYAPVVYRPVADYYNTRSSFNLDLNFYLNKKQVETTYYDNSSYYGTYPTKDDPIYGAYREENSPYGAYREPTTSNDIYGAYREDATVYGTYREDDTNYGAYREDTAVYGAQREDETIYGAYREDQTIYGAEREESATQYGAYRE